jgi:hypothetical protein
VIEDTARCDTRHTKSVVSYPQLRGQLLLMNEQGSSWLLGLGILT